MTTNSNSNAFQNSDGSEHNDRDWSDLAEKAMKCPGIATLDQWIDDSLEALEKEFSEFATHNSNRRNLGRQISF